MTFLLHLQLYCDKLPLHVQGESCLLNTDILRTDFNPRGTMSRHVSVLLFF